MRTRVILLVAALAAASCGDVDIGAGSPARAQGIGPGMVKCTTSGLLSGSCTYTSPLSAAAYTDGTSMTGSGSAGSGFSTAIGIATARTKIPGIYGSGVDGSLTFDGVAVVRGMTPTVGSGKYAGSNVYTLTKDINAVDMTVNASVAINGGGFRVFVTGTLTDNGTVDNSGGPASLSTAGVAGATGMCGTAGAGGSGAGGIAGGTVGASWFPLVASTGQSLGGHNAVGATSTVRTRGGGGGGGGVQDGANSGTTNVTAVSAGGPGFFDLMRCMTLSDVKVSGGTGGGGGGGDSTGTNGAGGGGGAGGWIIVGARSIAGTGTIKANGGNGGNASLVNWGGGGGGGGGYAVVFYSHRSGSVAITASAGLGGAGNGVAGRNGGDGAAGYAFVWNMSGDGT